MDMLRFNFFLHSGMSRCSLPTRSAVGINFDFLAAERMKWNGGNVQGLGLV